MTDELDLVTRLSRELVAACHLEKEWTYSNISGSEHGVTITMRKDVLGGYEGVVVKMTVTPIREIERPKLSIIASKP